MEVVYIDVLAMVNLTIDFLLLASAAGLAGVFTPRWRLLCGALLGTGYAVLSAFPVPEWMLWVPVRFGVGFAMVWAAFGKNAPLGRVYAVFLAVSCGLAGLTTALYFLTGTPLAQNGAYYIDVPLRVVLASGGLAYVLSGWLCRGAAKHGVVQKTTEAIELEAFGNAAQFTLLLDSGCDLTDPVSGRPVLLLERQAAARLLPADLRFICTALGSGAAETLSRIPENYRTAFRLLPFRAVGTEGGLLLMFRPQQAKRKDGAQFETYVAISPQRIAGGRYEGLIGL